MALKFQDDLLKDLNLEAVNMDTLPIATTVDEAAITRQEIELNSQVASNTNFFGSLGKGIQEEWLGGTVVNNWDRITSASGKPISKFTPELVRQLTIGLEDRNAVREVLEDAQINGLNSAMLTRESYLKTQSNLKYIERDGFSGTAAHAVAMMTAPEEWAAIWAASAAATSIGTPVAGGTVFMLGAGKKLRGAYKAATAAGIASAEAAVFEGIRAKYRYDIDGGDVAVAMGLSAALGGTFDAVSTTLIRNGQRQALAGKVARGEELTEVEQRWYDENNADALTQKIIQRELDGEKFLEQVDGIPTLNAADIKDEAVEAIPEIANVNLFWSMDKLRKLISTNYRLGTSKIGWARYASFVLGMNSTGYRGGKLATNTSASEHMEQLQSMYRDRMARIMPVEQDAWKKRTGGDYVDFNRLVTRYVRGLDTDAPQEVVRAGERVKEVQKEMGELAAEAGVSGFTKDMLNNPNYMSRIFNDDKIRGLLLKLGDDGEIQIAQLVETAIRQGQPNIEENVKNLLKKKLKKKVISKKDVDTYIARISKAYTRSITDPKLAKTGHAGANEMNLEDLSDILRAYTENGERAFLDGDIDDITELLTRTNIPKAHKRARNRMVLDEGATATLRNADGSVEEYSFSDLLEEDAEQLVNSYIFQMSGAIGLARNGINTNKANSGIDYIKDKIRAEGQRRRVSKEEIDDALASVDFMYDGITGRLAHRSDVSNKTREFNVAMRAFSFAVNMGMSGMSSLMELSNVLFEHSFETLFKSLPAYRNLITKLRDGDADDNLVQELVDGIGLGQEVSLGQWNGVTRLDTEDVGTQIISPERAWAGKRGWSTKALEGASKGTQFSQRKVAYWSGLTGVTQTLRRMSMVNFTNEFALKGAKGKLPFSPTKLRQLGLTDEMADRIRLTLLSDVVERNANGTVKKLNFDNWDEDVRAAFQTAGFKDARQNVQETNIGSMNRWMRSTEMGKTMFQFLSFTMASLEQQTARLAVRANAKDVAVAKVLTSAALMGSLMYSARVYMNAAGRSDREEYIKERMEMGAFISGSLSQIGAASIFSYILQLSSGAMQGNTYAITPPVIGLGTAFASTGKNIFDAAVEGEGLSETEWRTLMRLAPFQSLYGARQAMNAAADAWGN